MAEETNKPTDKNPRLKARVKVIVEELKQTANGEQVYEPTVYEQTIPAESLDLQAVIAAVNKNAEPKPDAAAAEKPTR